MTLPAWIGFAAVGWTLLLVGLVLLLGNPAAGLLVLLLAVLHLGVGWFLRVRAASRVN